MPAPHTKFLIVPTDLMQPSADRILVHLDAEPPRHFGLKVDTAPANHAMHLWIGSRQHKLEQLGPLQLAQGWCPARLATRLQSLHATIVVAMDPVSQSLPIHAVQFGRFSPTTSFQDHRYR